MASSAKRLRLGVLGLSVVVGVACAIVNVGSPGNLQRAAASTHVFVDTRSPSFIQRRVLPQDIDTLTKRTEIVARMLVSDPLTDAISAHLGLPPGQLSAFARTTADVPQTLKEPDSERRAVEIRDASFPYRLEVQGRTRSPILDIYAEAPTTRDAERLADGAVTALHDHLVALGARQALRDPQPLLLRQLGPARGGVVNSRAPMAIGVLTFLFTSALTAGGAFGVLALRRARARRDAAVVDEEPSSGGVAGDWPHTTRLLPWSLAAFIAMLWLIPFNEIQLNIPTPIDMTFDRLVLPPVAAVWVMAVIAGGRYAPRFPVTKVHLAVTAFLVFAFLSVVLGARDLNHSLEFARAVKRLPVLLAYTSLFFITASAVRRTEVRAFMTYTLGLALVCAIGMTVEYRFKYNVFYSLTDAVLPGIFTVGAADAGGIDGIGRRVVRGPAAIPLEAVAMLAMALPIGLVWLTHAKDWSRRFGYGAIVCLVLTATLTTFRKSGLVVPVSVIVTLAVFRRHELLRLAPLAVVLLVAVHILAPGAFTATASQLDSSRLAAPTVSDRAIDYDAVRPDVLSHLLIGRGWGSYDHVNYRILDTEILQRLIETGVLGLLAFLGMGVAVVAAARKTIHARDPRWAPSALVGAAAAVSFIVAATLFDVLSFPHSTYIFLYMSGLVAVVVVPERVRSPRPARPASRHEMREHGHDGRPSLRKRLTAPGGRARHPA